MKKWRYVAAAAIALAWSRPGHAAEPVVLQWQTANLVEKQFERPGSPSHAEVEAIFRTRTREEWRAFASEHDCCLEPVLDLDEALESELVRSRDMVVELDQPGAGAVRQLGVPVKLGRTPGGVRAPGPVLGEHTDEVLAGLGYSESEVAALKESGAVAGPAADVHRSFLT